ncbi:MAG: HEAT repeat domain-containing protein [Anaerolineae bacterium]|nr:HEAT repeat domain-containing protein [Anaerolineae bacterium]
MADQPHMTDDPSVVTDVQAAIEEQYDVFISYARRDGLNIVEQLEGDLAAANFTVWRDSRNLNPDQDFTAELEQAIERSSRVVVAITRDVRRDNSFVRREIAYALAVNKPVIPLIFEDTMPPIHIVNVTREDFTHTEWHEAVGKLVARLRGGEQPDDQRTTPPPDPFRDYLNMLYQQIIDYLRQTVFSEITLYSAQRKDVVDGVPDELRQQSLPALPVAFAAAAGLEDLEIPIPMQEENPEARRFHGFQEAYREYHERVLLLGAPGAGKTTTLMAFARDAVSARLGDPREPLPLLSIIATWDSRTSTDATGRYTTAGMPLINWLDEQNPALTRAQIETEIVAGRALLLLDGLDELGAESEELNPDNPDDPVVYDPRARFLGMLTQQPPFGAGLPNPDAPPILEPGMVPLMNRVVVSSRIVDFEAIGHKAALNGAVTLHPLNNLQMKEYLRDMEDLWNALETDEALLEVARTPLLLALFTFAYKDQEEQAANLRDMHDQPGELREAIFQQYIERRYAHEQRRLRVRDDDAELPFELDELWEVLGDAAFRNAIGGHGIEKNVIRRRDIAQAMLGRRTDEFVDFVVRLHLLTGDGDRFRFMHLMLRDTFAFPHALDLLDSRDMWVQLRASDVLGQLGDPRAVEPLISALTDRNVEVRRRAAEALGRIADPESHASLDVARASNVAWVPVPTADADAFAQIGRTAVDPLIRALTDSDKKVRGLAAEALGRIRDQRAIEALIEALNADEEAIRAPATRSLSKIGKAAVEQLIDTALHHEAPYALFNAARALGEMEEELLDHACDVLNDTLQDETDPEIILNAVNVFDAIGTPEARQCAREWHRKRRR